MAILHGHRSIDTRNKFRLSLLWILTTVDCDFFLFIIFFLGVTYLDTDRSWPGTRPEPSSLRPLAPWQCCAGCAPDAAAGNLQTTARGRSEGRNFKKKKKTKRANVNQEHFNAAAVNLSNTGNQTKCDKDSYFCGEEPHTCKILEWIIDLNQSSFPLCVAKILHQQNFDTPTICYSQGQTAQGQSNCFYFHWCGIDSGQYCWWYIIFHHHTTHIWTACHIED